MKKEMLRFCCIEPHSPFTIPLTQSSTRGTKLIWDAKEITSHDVLQSIFSSHFYCFVCNSEYCLVSATKPTDFNHLQFSWSPRKQFWYSSSVVVRYKRIKKSCKRSYMSVNHYWKLVVLSWIILEINLKLTTLSGDPLPGITFVSAEISCLAVCIVVLCWRQCVLAIVPFSCPALCVRQEECKCSASAKMFKTCFHVLLLSLLTELSRETFRLVRENAVFESLISAAPYKFSCQLMLLHMQLRI